MLKAFRALLLVMFLSIFSLAQLASHTIDCCDSETHSSASQDHHHSSCSHCSFSILTVEVAVEPFFSSKEYNDFKPFYFPNPEIRKPIEPPRA